MFVDIHSHILPNIDDGSKDVVMTIDMLKIAVQEGITSIIATPHFISGYNKYDKESLHKAYEGVKQVIIENNIPIDIYLGNEVYVDNDIVNHLVNGEAKTLGNTRYVLLELSNTWNDEIMEQIFYELELNNFNIILAHVERYDAFTNNLDLLRKYIDRGCLTQMNASTIVSKDRKTRKQATKLLKDGYIHFVSTDTHSNRRRKPAMREAYDFTKKLIGDKADDLFINNGVKLLNNEIIEATSPIRNKNKLFSFFKEA